MDPTIINISSRELLVTETESSYVNVLDIVRKLMLRLSTDTMSAGSYSRVQ